jgi:hypothetical protein
MCCVCVRAPHPPPRARARAHTHTHTYSHTSPVRAVWTRWQHPALYSPRACPAWLRRGDHRRLTDAQQTPRSTRSTSQTRSKPAPVSRSSARFVRARRASRGLKMDEIKALGTYKGEKATWKEDNGDTITRKAERAAYLRRKYPLNSPQFSPPLPRPGPPPSPWSTRTRRAPPSSESGLHRPSPASRAFTFAYAYMYA